MSRCIFHSSKCTLSLQVEVKECKEAVQEQKQRLAAAAHEVQAAVRKAEKLKKENNELELQLKQQEYQIQKLASEAKAASQKVLQSAFICKISKT